MQAIKAASAFCSDIPGAATSWWILLFLSFYMLYLSYTNLHKHKACLAINNPAVISWTRYLVRMLCCQKIIVDLYLTILILNPCQCVLNTNFIPSLVVWIYLHVSCVTDSEQPGSVCLVVSLECYGGSGHSLQIQSWCTRPSGQLSCPHHHLIVHYNLVRTKELEILKKCFIFDYSFVSKPRLWGKKNWQNIRLPSGSSYRSSS